MPAHQTTIEEQIAEAQERRRSLTSLQNQAYNSAWQRLREKYRDEYDSFIDEEFDKRGLERKRRSTAAQREERLSREKLAKAEAKLDALLADNPDLKEVIKAKGL